MSAPADRTTRRCAKFFLLLRGRQGRHRPGKLPPLQFFLPAAFCLRDERELCRADRGSPRADLAHKISEVTVGQVYPVVLRCLSIWLPAKYYPFQYSLIWLSKPFWFVTTNP